VVLAAGLFGLMSTSAYATFHLWDFNELFTNADGTIQFIELFTSFNGQQFASGESFLATQGVATHSFVFPSNTPAPTANHNLLVATAGFAALPGAPTPDFIMPDGFLFAPDGSVQNLAVFGPTITYASLPTDGLMSLAGDGSTVAVNSPTNYAGDTGSIDVSSNVHAASAWGLCVMVLGLGICGTVVLRARDGTSTAFRNRYGYDNSLRAASVSVCGTGVPRISRAFTTARAKTCGSGGRGTYDSRQ